MPPSSEPLLLLCDGSAAATTWGTGVYVPSTRAEHAHGGWNQGLGILSERDETCDKTVAEVLAFCHACQVAADTFPNAAQVEIVIDCTTWVTNFKAGTRVRQTLQKAFEYWVKDALMRVLHRFRQVTIVHKRCYGWGDGWPPDHLAKWGRTNRNDTLEMVSVDTPDTSLFSFTDEQHNEHGQLQTDIIYFQCLLFSPVTVRERPSLDT